MECREATQTCNQIFLVGVIIWVSVWVRYDTIWYDLKWLWLFTQYDTFELCHDSWIHGSWIIRLRLAALWKDPCGLESCKLSLMKPRSCRDCVLAHKQQQQYSLSSQLCCRDVSFSKGVLNLEGWTGIGSPLSFFLGVDNAGVTPEHLQQFMNLLGTANDSGGCAGWWCQATCANKAFSVELLLSQAFGCH